MNGPRSELPAAPMGGPGATASLHAKPSSRTGAAFPWFVYLSGLAGTFAAMFLLYGGIILTLDRAGSLPPPAIVNELCADEKLAWLRTHPPVDPNLLIVGSSLAWRNVDSAEFVRANPAARPLNGGVCHTQINQSTFVADYLVAHLPSIRTVVVLVAPQDMLECARVPRELFDPTAADGYAFERRWAYSFYISHFDVVSLLRNARGISAMREGHNAAATLEMSPYGDGPMRVSGDPGMNLQYAGLKAYDATCFVALHDFAGAITRSGRDLLVSTNPINPTWSRLYDRDKAREGALATGLRAALRGTGARFWDGASDFVGTPPEFTDAIHLNWTAAQRFTAKLAAALNSDQNRL